VYCDLYYEAVVLILKLGVIFHVVNFKELLEKCWCCLLHYQGVSNTAFIYEIRNPLRARTLSSYMYAMLVTIWDADQVLLSLLPSK
jgi:hypothetical protein